jgi:GNAT superfamily N-acetyltransferase
MREEHRTGIRYLEAVTTLLQRVRAAHPTAGVFEAADFQWWWRSPRSTDALPQLFWFDDSGLPEAAVIATDWGETMALDPIVMPGASEESIGRVVERGLAHARDSGLGEVEIAIARSDEVIAGALAANGYTHMEDELVDAWLAAEDRPVISTLHPAYRLASRLETTPAPHHMIPRGGPDVEERLRQTSLYRADLDLVVLDGDDNAAAYGLFWFDPVTATGLVEPMRTGADHQRRGLARHVLTTGLDLLAKAGAERIKIAWDQDNPGASKLYNSVGFTDVRPCAVVSRST